MGMKLAESFINMNYCKNYLSEFVQADGCSFCESLL